MIQEQGSDLPIEYAWKHGKWIIVYEGPSKAVGLFSFKTADLRADPSGRTLQESYNFASEDGSVTLYYATGTRDELVTMFESMKLGYQLGPELKPGFDFVSPIEGQSFAPGEILQVVVFAVVVDFGRIEAGFYFGQFALQSFQAFLQRVDPGP